LGRYDEAIEYFDKVLAIEPNNKDVQDAKSFALDKLNG
jgi:tetratricopeptide (TPR) repeat protein